MNGAIVARIIRRKCLRKAVESCNLAKQRGISVARTKEDFLRIIKANNPDEDLERLKDKVLFDRVSEFHISRLRTKQDLVRPLSA